MNKNIFIIDDDIELLKMLKTYFNNKGYQVITAQNGIDALEKLDPDPDIILLDINMPRLDGIEFCKKIRDIITCPILFLTAKVEEEDRVNGLLSGGDDYILKPFSLLELEARIIAHLNREQRSKSRSEIKYSDGLIIDYSSKKLIFDETEITLTNLEYLILELLSKNPGQVFDKVMIYEKTCGYDANGDSRVVTEIVRRLRNKIAKHTDTEYIETIWGIGYKWKK